MAKPLDYATFRQTFPEFSDQTKYPDAMLQMYYTMACAFVVDPQNSCAMLDGDQIQVAQSLMTAHILSLWAANAQAAAGGSVGGNSGGYEVSSSIGEVSVSRMAPPARSGWQWWLASTPYGSSLWALLSIASVGGTSVGGLPEGDAFRKVGGTFDRFGPGKVFL